MAQNRPFPTPPAGGASDLPPPAARLYLVTPPALPAARLAAALADALDAADVAAVLLRLPDAGESALIETIATLAPTVQSRNAALLLDGHPELAARTGADGAHLTGLEPFSAALSLLKPDRIAGAGGLRSRHDAMLAAERGADYVMFGEPGDGGRPPFEAVLTRVEWWAELFEAPCVGYAESLDEAAALARAGADFVALGEFAVSDSRAPSAIIRAAAGLLRDCRRFEVPAPPAASSFQELRCERGTRKHGLAGAPLLPKLV
jgi:thiamine-phosphate pyrophosphorylase